MRNQPKRGKSKKSDEVQGGAARTPRKTGSGTEAVPDRSRPMQGRFGEHDSGYGGKGASPKKSSDQH